MYTHTNAGETSYTDKKHAQIDEGEATNTQKRKEKKGESLTHPNRLFQQFDSKSEEKVIVMHTKKAIKRRMGKGL